MELRDVASVVLYALGVEQPDNYTGRVPFGIWEGIGGEERKRNDLNEETRTYRNHSVSEPNEKALPSELSEHLAYQNDFDDGNASGFYGNSTDCREEYEETNLVWNEDWNQLTIAFWIKAEQGSGDPVIISNKNWTSGTNAGLVIAQKENSITFNIGDRHSKRYDMIIPLPSDYWDGWTHYLVSMDLDRQTISVYCDFQYWFTDQIQGNITLDDVRTADQFVIGQDVTLGYKYDLNANVDDVMVFNKVLSETEVEKLQDYYK